MFAMLRTVHVLAVALWFGSVAFFTVAGVLIFGAFEKASLARARPLWFPSVSVYEKDVPPESNFPDPLLREQGSRAAGTAVSGIFPVFFALQAGCGVVAVLTALVLACGQGSKLNGIRLLICILALTTALGGWWLERRVHDLRKPRNTKTDVVLVAESPTEEQIAEARAARAEFGKWHGISLVVNIGTLGLTLIAAGLAAHFRAET